MKKLALVLLVLLAVAAAIPSTRARMADAISPIVEGFRARMVPGRLEAIADELDGVLASGRSFPDDWERWLRDDYTGGPARDAWGNYFFLDTRRRTSFTVGSMGPDGERGTEDDITLEREVAR